MKKVIVVLTVVTVLAIGAVAFAGPGWYGGHMGPGYGGYMMGPGYGGYMMGPAAGYDQKFLDETADIRKELNEKTFDYNEAIRNPNTDEKTIEALEKDITGLQEKLYTKAPRTARGFGGYGPCWR